MPVHALQRRHLDAVVAVADTGSVHAAARLLGIAQPALSRLLADAERALGARLYTRSSAGSRPTDNGLTLVASARFLLRGLERLEAAAETERAPIRLGCIARGMHTLVPTLLERLYPLGQRADATRPFCLVEGSTAALLSAAAAGELDFAVVRSSGDGPDGIALHVEPLYEERTVIIAAAHSDLPTGPLTLARLAAHDWILPDVQTGSRASFDRHWRDQGLKTIRPLVETRSFETSLALVARTRFLSIAPESVARRHQALGGVRIVRTRRALPSSPVSLVCLRFARDDPSLEAFRDAIRAAAAQARAALREVKG